MATDAFATAEHERAYALLPWYVNGTLEEAESQLVSAHLSSCRICEEELADCAELQAAVRRTRQESWEPGPEHLASLMAQLGAGTAGRVPAQSPWSRLRDWLTAPPGWGRWVLIPQTALAAGLAGLIVWQSLGAAPADYRTLTSPPTAAAPLAGHVLDVAFRDDLREIELRALLRTLEAELVAGPSELGVYTVVVPASISRAGALERLRGHPGVRLAEPARVPAP